MFYHNIKNNKKSFYIFDEQNFRLERNEIILMSFASTM
jgi:hypothetical protein